MKRWSGFLLVCVGALPALAQQDELAGYITRGKNAYRNEDHESAIDNLGKAAERLPRDSEVRFLLASSYLKRGRALRKVGRLAEVAPACESAIKHFQIAAELSPPSYGEDARAQVREARVEGCDALVLSGDQQRAARAFAEAEGAYRQAFEWARAAADEPRLAGARRRAQEAAAARFAQQVRRGAGAEARRAVILPAEDLADPQRDPLAALAAALEAAIAEALRGVGFEVLSPESAGAVDLVVQSRIGPPWRLCALRLEADEDRVVAELLPNSFGLEVRGKEPEAAPPIRLELAVEAQRNSGLTSEQSWSVKDGGRLATGDVIRIKVKADREAHLYVFFFDSQGRAVLLFPGTELRFAELRGVETRARTPAEQEVLIPPRTAAGAARALRLKEPIGLETVYAIAALDPLPDIEDRLRLLELSKEGRATHQRRLKELAQDYQRRSRYDSFRIGRRGPAERSHLEILKVRWAVTQALTFEQSARPEAKAEPGKAPF